MEIKNKNLFREQCYINGEWVNSNNKEIIEVNNPSTLQIIAKVPKCGKMKHNMLLKKQMKLGIIGKIDQQLNVLLFYGSGLI